MAWKLMWTMVRWLLIWSKCRSYIFSWIPLGAHILVHGTELHRSAAEKNVITLWFRSYMVASRRDSTPSAGSSYRECYEIAHCQCQCYEIAMSYRESKSRGEEIPNIERHAIECPLFLHRSAVATSAWDQDAWCQPSITHKTSNQIYILRDVGHHTGAVDKVQFAVVSSLTYHEHDAKAQCLLALNGQNQIKWGRIQPSFCSMEGYGSKKRL